jgi:predicted Rossmann fold flavoprotein
MVLNMSKAIGDILPYGEVTLELDIFPEQDHVGVKSLIQDLLIKESNKMIKNTLPAILPVSFVESFLEQCKISGETYNHSVSHEDRQIIIHMLKALPLRVKGLLGAEKAIVSSGGVDLKEVNFKSMESRLVPGLYIVGDVLNIERPSGGYSLQLCWTTGFVAGDSV